MREHVKLVHSHRMKLLPKQISSLITPVGGAQDRNADKLETQKIMFIYQVHLCCLGATFQHISWPNHGMTFLRASNPLRCTTLRPVSPIIWPILMTRFVARPIALSVTLVTGSAVGLVTNLYTGLGTK